MDVYAAVMTGQGVGAIASIGVFGETAQVVLGKVFTRTKGKAADFKQGDIYVGTIQDGDRVIDQVMVGCEGENSFAINCHGNPLIVEMIMQVLSNNGVTPITAAELNHKILAADGNLNAIAIEAKLALPRAKTLAGSKIIANQIEGGLQKKVQEWINKTESVSLEQIQIEAGQILRASETARLIMFGCKAVLAGPANSGKSTLFNCICGRDKAIVSSIKGTTRDWVSAECVIGNLSVELIDTAGVEGTEDDGAIEKAAQEASLKSLQEADLVLLVLDGSQPGGIDERLAKAVKQKRVLHVLNKSDLGVRVNQKFGKSVNISAKFAENIEEVLTGIEDVCGVRGFDLNQPVCITARQKGLLKELTKADSRDAVSSILNRLLDSD